MCMNSAHSSTTGARAQDAVDVEDAQGPRAEGFDPDEPAVVAAIDMVRWELSQVPGTVPRPTSAARRSATAIRRPLGSSG
jgi:hypothetical protein